jgi:2-dehydro-3-deoxygalactonokinase
MIMNTFLSCDWGTSAFRLRLVNAGGREIEGEVISDDGIAGTYQQWLASGKPESERIRFYRNVLDSFINKLRGTMDKTIPVICSGMISSSIGLVELPYRKFPFTWDVSQIIVKKLDGDKEFPRPIYIVSGFKTDADIMRGEEILLLGCDVEDEGEKIFIFPGTHSKHVFVKNKKGMDFKTYMTGEIFNLLSEKSILANAVRKGADENSFVEGFNTGLQGNILHQVFRVRTRQLLEQSDPVSNYQFLSGLLISSELRDLKNSDCPVYLVAGEHLEHAYRLGLSLMGVKREINFLSGSEMLLNGHCKMANFIFK